MKGSEKNEPTRVHSLGCQRKKSDVLSLHDCTGQESKEVIRERKRREMDGLVVGSPRPTSHSIAHGRLPSQDFETEVLWQ